MTLRAVVLGSVIALVFALVIPYNDAFLLNTYIAGNHFPVGAVFVLVILTLGVNSLLRWWAPRVAFSKQELLVVWCLVWIPSGLPSSGLGRYLFPQMVGPFYYAQGNPLWSEVLFPLIPDWLVPTKDAASPVVKHFYELQPGGAAVPWGAWARPLLWWFLLCGFLYLMMYGLSAILRKQWVEHERLSYPLVQLPLEMCETGATGEPVHPFYRDRLVWIGFLVPVVIRMLEGLSVFYPEVPKFPMTFWIRDLLARPPWSYATPWALNIYPMVIGFCFLISLEISFSMWFFFVFFQLELIVGGSIGEPLGGGYSDFGINQQSGAFFAFTVFLLWQARGHLAATVRAAWQGGSARDDGETARWAVGALVVGFLGAMLWYCAAGTKPIMACLAILIFLSIILVMSRIVTQGGIPFVQQALYPSLTLNSLFGAAGVGAQSIAVLNMSDLILAHDLRELMTPNLMNSLKISTEARIPHNKLLLASVLPVALVLVAMSWSNLKLAYGKGASNLERYGKQSCPQWSSNRVVNWIRGGGKTKWTDVAYMGLGAGLLTFFSLMKAVFPWFPVHPLGLLMANTYATTCIFFSIFLAWLIKLLVLRYGGAGGYRRGRSFFLGVVLGESVMAGIWIIVGLITGKHTINILPS